MAGAARRRRPPVDESVPSAGGALSGGDALLDAISAVVADVDHASVVRRVVDSAARLVDADHAACALFDAAGDVAEIVCDEGLDEFGALISSVTEQVRAADELVRLDRILALPIRVRDRSVGVLSLVRRPDRVPFDDNDVARLRAFAGPASVAVANARDFEVGRLRERWLETLAGVATSLLSGGELSEVLPAVVRQARDIVEADGAAVALPSDDAQVVIVLHADGFGAERILGANVPTDGSFLGSSLRRGTTIQVDELATDERVTFRHGLVDVVGPAIYVPLGTPASVRGVLFVYNRVGGAAFDEHAVGMLNAFAAQVAVALELAERRNDATMLALYEDRERIARDLHDVVIQRLFAIGLTLEGASHSITDPDAGRRVTRAVDDLDQTIKQIRTTIFGLQAPAEPAFSGLRARVVSVIDQEIHALGFVPALRFEGLIDTVVSPELADQVVAVLREVLSNVARHARASTTEVRLSATTADLSLVVVDDGVGIAAGDRRSGVHNMENRALAHGGHLSISGQVPRGTRVEWSVPLRRQD